MKLIPILLALGFATSAAIYAQTRPEVTVETPVPKNKAEWLKGQGQPIEACLAAAIVTILRAGGRC